MIENRRYPALAAGLAAAAALFALAGGTATWEMNSYGDFIRGRFHGVSLGRDGRLTLAPKVDPVFTSDQPVIWRSRRRRMERSTPPPATAAGSTASTRRVSPRCCGRPINPRCSPSPWNANGGASTPARRRTEKCIASATARPKSTSRRTRATSGRWPSGRMARSTLAPATRARCFASKAAGKGELYYDTGQAHMTGLAVDRRAACWRAPNRTACCIA